YETVYVDMYKYALYMLRNPEDAEDAVADAVTDAYLEIKNLRSEDAFKGWIFRILSAKCKNKRKTYAVDSQNLSDVEDAAEQIGVTEADFSNCEIKELLENLPYEDRMILLLHKFSGYSSAEIGKILGINENTVRSREHRAIKKLKTMLA
ncbi:MAG: sigma-70 family RNA polymerase sigma factor, partial [Lachnospiraceae bacterium]|nr:sigma-70 family RNA polymerase sigma factor [Lachnospiraceae bacterium]